MACTDKSKIFDMKKMMKGMKHKVTWHAFFMRYAITPTLLYELM